MEDERELLSHNVPSIVLNNGNNTDLIMKRQLQSLKRELKGWEAMFERKHGHKPTRCTATCSYGY